MDKEQQNDKSRNILVVDIKFFLWLLCISEASKHITSLLGLKRSSTPGKFILGSHGHIGGKDVANHSSVFLIECVVVSQFRL